MRSIPFVLGLCSVAIIHPALARQLELTASGGEPPVVTMPRGPDQGLMPWPGPNGPMRHRQEGQHRVGPLPEFMLAAQLSMIETRIGVRTAQLDAWRDYTSALQAILPPPRPDHGLDHGFGGSGARGSGAGAAGSDGKGTADPFAFGEGLADDVGARAVAAAKLKDAIAKLRAKLSPKQLEILASAERPLEHPPGAPGAARRMMQPAPGACPMTEARRPTAGTASNSDRLRRPARYPTRHRAGRSFGMADLSAIPPFNSRNGTRQCRRP